MSEQLRVVLGEGYPYPASVERDIVQGQEYFGVKVYDAQGRVASLDRDLLLRTQGYWVCVVLEVVGRVPPAMVQP